MVGASSGGGSRPKVEPSKSTGGLGAACAGAGSTWLETAGAGGSVASLAVPRCVLGGGRVSARGGCGAGCPSRLVTTGSSGRISAAQSLRFNGKYAQECRAAVGDALLGFGRQPLHRAVARAKLLLHLATDSQTLIGPFCLPASQRLLVALAPGRPGRIVGRGRQLVQIDRLRHTRELGPADAASRHGNCQGRLSAGREQARRPQHLGRGLDAAGKVYRVAARAVLQPPLTAGITDLSGARMQTDA